MSAPAPVEPPPVEQAVGGTLPRLRLFNGPRPVTEPDPIPVPEPSAVVQLPGMITLLSWLLSDLHVSRTLVACFEAEQSPQSRNSFTSEKDETAEGPQGTQVTSFRNVVGRCQSMSKLLAEVVSSQSFRDVPLPCRSDQGLCAKLLGHH